MSKYEELAPTIAKHLTKEQAFEALPPQVVDAPSKTTEPGKEAVLEALKYVRLLGVEQVAKVEADFITLGPREIVKRVAAAGHDISVDQVKALTRELRQVKVLREVEQVEAKAAAEAQAKIDAEAAAKQIEEANPTEPAPPLEPDPEPKEPVLEPKEPTK